MSSITKFVFGVKNVLFGQTQLQYLIAIKQKL